MEASHLQRRWHWRWSDDDAGDRQVPFSDLCAAAVNPARRLRALAATVGGWMAQRAARWRLARLDDRTLQDLGLTRGDVEREFARLFRQPMDTEALALARRNAGPRLGGRRG